MASNKGQYYHYTSAESASKIDQSKVIIGSTQNNHDALYGDGVYLTDKKAEDYTRTHIARNNYGPRDGLQSKLEKYVEVSLPANEVQKCDTSSNRQVYLYPGDLDLSKYDHSIKDAKFKGKK